MSEDRYRNLHELPFDRLLEAEASHGDRQVDCAATLRRTREAVPLAVRPCRSSSAHAPGTGRPIRCRPSSS
jgi:hypothetical protein